MIMLRTVVFTVIGLAVALLATLFTASLVVAFAGIATVLLAGRAMTMRMQQKAQPAYVYADRRNANRAQPVRIWNDGRGTIIDM